MCERLVTIDPGAKGAICLLDLTSMVVEFIATKTPARKIMDKVNQFNPEEIWIEDVHALYGSSAKATFSFGFHCGYLIGMLESYGYFPKRIQPKIWQKEIGVKSKGKEIKQEVAQIVSEYFNYPDIYGKRGGLMDGRSDALGIALYVIKTRGNQ